jgi:hypothetical protein
MNGWHFTRETDGWRWHRMRDNAGGVPASSTAFRSLLECIEHATKNGYSLGIPARNPTLRFHQNEGAAPPQAVGARDSSRA